MRLAMSLERLSVVHVRKAARNGGTATASNVLLPAAFALETCLRRIWITSNPAQSDRLLAASIGAEHYSGAEAYEFLLRIACGLESAITGESDVFGQLKECWKSFQSTRAEGSRALEPLVQHLFEDVKEIRSRHLSGLGAATYGSLVRKLLNGRARAPTLVIGAGQMARAVLPYLPGRPLWIANRTPAHASALLSGIGSCLSPSTDIDVLPAAVEAELGAWRRASNIVVCVPSDPERDALRVQAWNSSDVPGRQLLHLGILDAAGTGWGCAAGMTTLSDLFALQSANQDVRQLRFHRAGRACRERARLRNLGGPVNLAHGWEDLSLFANIA
jgi:hypothetical protein